MRYIVDLIYIDFNFLGGNFHEMSTEGAFSTISIETYGFLESQSIQQPLVNLGPKLCYN